jgi:hypothetical protein
VSTAGIEFYPAFIAKGNAVLDNFEQDLGMTGNQLNIAVTIFYVRMAIIC